MSAIDPKGDFQKFSEDTAKLARSTFPQPWFRHTINTALAQVVMGGTTEMELNGIRKFLAVLVNLGETEIPVQRMPVKTLDVLSPEQPPEPPKKS